MPNYSVTNYESRPSQGRLSRSRRSYWARDPCLAARWPGTAEGACPGIRPEPPGHFETSPRPARDACRHRTTRWPGTYLPASTGAAFFPILATCSDSAVGCLALVAPNRGCSASVHWLLCCFLISSELLGHRL